MLSTEEFFRSTMQQHARTSKSGVVYISVGHICNLLANMEHDICNGIKD
jgi:hypothetical protein